MALRNEIDGIALRAVVCGSVVAAVGLVADVWFLVIYNGMAEEQFKVCNLLSNVSYDPLTWLTVLPQRAAQDVYGTYLNSPDSMSL